MKFTDFLNEREQSLIQELGPTMLGAPAPTASAPAPVGTPPQPGAPGTFQQQDPQTSAKLQAQQVKQIQDQKKQIQDQIKATEQQLMDLRKKLAELG